MQKNLNIAILTANPNSYSNVRLKYAASKRGHSLKFLNTLQGLLTESPAHMKNSDMSSFCFYNAVIPRIGSPLTNLGIAYIGLFENANVYSTVSANGLLLSRDKLIAAQNLNFNKIATPRTVTITSMHQFDNAVKHVKNVPFVLKMIRGSQGRSVMLVESLSMAKSLIETLINMRIPFLLQEYIEESSGTDIRCFVIDGKVVGAMKRTAQPGEFRSNIHQGARAEKVELTAREKRIAVKSTKVLNLDIGGVDLLRSKRGPLVLEVNSSPGLKGIEHSTDIDIADKIIELIESKVKSVIRIPN